MVRLRLKNIKKRTRKPIMNLQELRKEGAIKRYNIAAKNTYEVLAHNNDMDELEKE